MALERSFSPGRAMYESRRDLQEKIDTMTFMGLHVFDPDWNNHGLKVSSGSVVKATTLHSATFRDCTLKIHGGEESFTIPVQVCTQVADVKNVVAAKAMVYPHDLTFLVKQGCYWKTQLDDQEVGRVVYVKGIKSFSPRKHQYAHPTAIIGAGYNGIKNALYWLHHGDTNFVMFDRYDRVGGHAWLVQANKTSKLQTEFAAFHVWFGCEWGADNKRLGFPTDWETWPRKAKVIEHIQHAAERYGILPYIRFRVNITDIDIIGKLTDFDRTYSLRVKSLDRENEESQFTTCNILHFPGAYFNARIIDYPGEDEFGGQIGYGMNDDIPFDHLEKSRTAILGNGAYAVENIRTCCEYGAEKVYLITRRKNLALPRLCCWFCHQALVPTPASMLLELMEPMYKVGLMGDPWEYHAVYGTKGKGSVIIRSNSRFGIGDVTFLAVAVGRCEYVQDLLKRCTHQTLHLEGGRKIENIHNIIKALGLIADFEADRMHKIKEMIGMWPSGDHRRIIFCDPLGMDAQNFTTHSTGGGSYQTSVQSKFFFDYPFEHKRLMDANILDLLPRMKATEDKPAHQVNAKYAMMAGVTVGSMCPNMIMLTAGMDDYMHELFWAVNPRDKYYKECKDSWDQYQKDWAEQGYPHEYVEFPYSEADIDRWFEEFDKHVGPNSLKDKPNWRPADQRHVVATQAQVESLKYDKGGASQWWQERSTFATHKS